MFLQFKKIQKPMSTLIHKKLEILEILSVSDQSGKSNIISRLKTIGIEIEEKDPKD